MKKIIEIMCRYWRPHPSDGAMIVYDVRTLPSGGVEIGKPYRRFPDGRIERIAKHGT